MPLVQPVRQFEKPRPKGPRFAGAQLGGDGMKRGLMSLAGLYLLSLS